MLKLKIPPNTIRVFKEGDGFDVVEGFDTLIVPMRALVWLQDSSQNWGRQNGITKFVMQTPDSRILRNNRGGDRQDFRSEGFLGGYSNPKISPIGIISPENLPELIEMVIGWGWTVNKEVLEALNK